MKIYEIGTGYTSIPPQISAATETVVEELSRSLRKLGADVVILDIQDPRREKTDLPLVEVPFPRVLQRHDLQLGLFHKVKRVLYSFSLAHTLQKLLKQSDETVILHFHNQYNQFFFQLLTAKKWQKKAKIVYTNHNGHWSRSWKEVKNLLWRKYFQEIFCMKSADIVFALNPRTKENILQNLGLPEERVRLIGNGVNPRIYRPLSEAERASYRKKWKLESRRLILQVGSVNENKGQKRSLKQILPLLKEDPQLLFGYVGAVVDKTYHQELIDMAKEEGVAAQVRYFGMVPPGEELNGLYNCAEATIHASEYEAFGLVIVESMAAGIPILLCAESQRSLPPTVQQAAEQRNVDGLRRMATELFSWDEAAKQYDAVFRSMERGE